MICQVWLMFCLIIIPMVNCKNKIYYKSNIILPTWEKGDFIKKKKTIEIVYVHVYIYQNI